MSAQLSLLGSGRTCYYTQILSVPSIADLPGHQAAAVEESLCPGRGAAPLHNLEEEATEINPTFWVSGHDPLCVGIAGLVMASMSSLENPVTWCNGLR